MLIGPNDAATVKWAANRIDELQSDLDRSKRAETGLLAEIRSLNDALTAANNQLASYRALPLVPAAEHTRVKDQRDDALRLCDALTRELANLRDGRAQTLSAERLAIMQDVARYAGRWSFGHDGERDAFQWLFAHVAEYGRAPEVEEFRAAQAEWEGRR